MTSLQRLFDILSRQEELFPKEDALAAKVNGAWKATSTAGFRKDADRASKSFLSLGLKKGDTVAIISANRPEWNMLDIGLQQAGIVSVPIYTTLSESEIAFILNDSETKFVFAGDQPL